MKRIIKTDKAPAAVGPYSQAVEINNTLYISGQIPLDPLSGTIKGEDITEQTRQVFSNIEAILGEAGYGFGDVVRSTCYLSDMKDFKAMNAVYAEYYKAGQPARAAFAVRELPLGVLVEIDAIAAK